MVPALGDITLILWLCESQPFLFLFLFTAAQSPIFRCSEFGVWSLELEVTVLLNR